MTEPDFERDGWCLEDGEELHRAAPKTFWIPPLNIRQLLHPGDLAKLVFRIAVQGEPPVAVERIWVIVRERTSTGYMGMLDNEPDAIAENDSFWVGTELPFEFRHIVGVDHGNAESVRLATLPAPIPWPRED